MSRTIRSFVSAFVIIGLWGMIAFCGTSYSMAGFMERLPVAIIWLVALAYIEWKFVLRPSLNDQSSVPARPKSSYSHREISLRPGQYNSAPASLQQRAKNPEEPPVEKYIVINQGNWMRDLSIQIVAAVVGGLILAYIFGIGR